MRKTRAALPELSELQTVQHFTRLSRKNFSVDTALQPLGSCGTRYTPRGADSLAMLPEFLARHPEAPEGHSQGFLACLYDLQEMLRVVTGMQGISLTPAAGAQGEFAGVAMIKAYHAARQEFERDEMLVSAADHGSKQASVVMCGYKVRSIPTKPDGDIDLASLKTMLGRRTAGVMLTIPSGLGVFDRGIEAVAALVHGVGALLHCDGVNLTAILGKVRPGDMGFDVVHLDLHKGFFAPHGGGGPGAGPVGVSASLLPYLPVPIVGLAGDRYSWLCEQERPESIGRLSAFAGNAGVLLRVYVNLLMLGREGITRVAEYATLNANYLLKELMKAGFEAVHPDRRATHEFGVTLRRQVRELEVSSRDISKRLLDYGVDAPATWFPPIFPECLLLKPAETENKETLDRFVGAMKSILKEAETDPDLVKGAPYRLPVRRLDDVRAARDLDLAWKPANG